MTRLPTAKELDLFDVEVPEGQALSVFPYAQEYMEDPFWYDPGGRNPFHRKRVHKMSAGEGRKRKVGEVVEEYPRYGPKMYEWAVEQDDPSLLRELLDLGVSLDVKKAKLVLEDDLDETGDVDPENESYPRVDIQPALHAAAFDGKLECVKVLVEDGHVDINAKDDHDSTPLTNALVNGHEEVVDWLLEHGANITFEAENVNDIQAALRSSKVSLVKKLLEHPHSVERKVHIEPSHIRWAADSITGDPLEMVRFVLQSDCFGSPITRSQKDAIVQSLGHVVSAASIESVRLLLPYLTEQKDDDSFEYVELPDTDVANIFNATEDAMVKQDIPELFELLWETLLCNPSKIKDPKGQPTVSPEDRLNRRLISACGEGCVETCRLLVDKYGADVHHVSHKFSTTPLSRATASTANPLERRLPVVRYLLEEKHVNIHLADGEFANDATALASIVRFGTESQEEMVKLMLKNGGPLEEIDDGIRKVVEEAKAGAKLKLWLVVREVARYPATLSTREQRADDETEEKRSQIGIEASKEEWKTWLESMQIRKSDKELAAEDPKGRPLP